MTDTDLCFQETRAACKTGQTPPTRWAPVQKFQAPSVVREGGQIPAGEVTLREPSEMVTGDTEKASERKKDGTMWQMVI